MKKIFVLLLGMGSLWAQAQQLPNEPEEKPVPLEVIAPSSISFMGRTFHFAYWEVLAVNPYLPNPLTLQPSWGYRPNKNGVPNIHATYAIKRGITPNTFLEIDDELLIFNTEITEPTSNARTKVISCAGGAVVSYSVFEGEDLITTVVTKHTVQGNIIFSGVLKRNPKKSVEVNTRQIETDFGTFTHEHETVKFDTKSIEKEALKYARAMCRNPFPEWLKNVPTVEEIRNQVGEQPQKQIAAATAPKSLAPNKIVSAPAKTVVPKLQSTRPVYRSGQ